MIQKGQLAFGVVGSLCVASALKKGRGHGEKSSMRNGWQNKTRSSLAVHLVGERSAKISFFVNELNRGMV